MFLYLLMDRNDHIFLYNLLYLDFDDNMNKVYQTMIKIIYTESLKQLLSSINLFITLSNNGG